MAIKKRDEIKSADCTWFEDPTKCNEIPHPSFREEYLSNRFEYNHDTGCFKFMGRRSVLKLKNGIQKSHKMAINILGTNLFGKSHIIAAYVVFRMNACFKEESDAHPILFLPQCGDLAKMPGLYLQEAMLLAFAANEEMLGEITTLARNTDDLLNWLENKTFDVFADQANDLDEKNLIPPAKKISANDVLDSLQEIVIRHKCKMMKGYSANNEIMALKFDKEKMEGILTFYGGLEEVFISCCF